jgi:1-acyl-sn-glycerol-3-phosphate acyltransferase
MNEENDLIQYPRKVIARKSLTLLGKMLLWLLAKVQITGKDKLPKHGPIILAGNHIAALEAVLMAVYTPGSVEFLGTGDIPFDPNYAWITKAYDLIPINRGNLDRKGLRLALHVLKQDGILGIFPEGGTWNPAQMEAQTGIAWLSYKAQAPILPIGFGGTRGALANAFRLKHPKLTMNVGELLPAVSIENKNLSLKENLQLSANHILSEIKNLIPEEDMQAFQRIVDEEFDLEIEFLSLDGEVIESDIHI